MIAEAALKLAGDQAAGKACLVARPTGVAHVYTGPLTPSGRFAPRTARTVCRAHTRQLHVLPLPERWTSLGARAAALLPRLCSRCTACLDRDRDRSRQATSHWRSRSTALGWYLGTSKADVAFALELAQTPAEVDAAAWLSLLVFDVAGCNQPFTAHGRTWPSLHNQVCLARSRVHGYPESSYRSAELDAIHAAAARDARRAQAKEVRRERDDRIGRLGMNNAHPEVRPARRR